MNTTKEIKSTEIFENFESNVRSYCRSFPEFFNRAKGPFLYNREGKEYIDFLMGAGALNYGHNNDFIKEQVLNYIEKDGVIQGLDMYTNAKEGFISYMQETVLGPKDMDFKFMFCGPTGTNAIEAALKLARKYTKRNGVFAFMGGYHGMTLGSLAVTSNSLHRNASGVSLDNVTFIPYEDGYLKNFDSIEYIEALLNDSHSGIEKPAAIILETIQAEGGVYVSSIAWLKAIRSLCDAHGILLICDEIQVGCGRAGDFFSFERAGIQPDIIALSKSISGYGFPLSMLLFKPEFDIWEPAEHNGTFRGHQLSFVGGKAALEFYHKFYINEQVGNNSVLIENFFYDEIIPMDSRIIIRGLGMIWGIDFGKFKEGLTNKITESCFEKGLVIESAGRGSTVIKLLPALTIDIETLSKGLTILKESISEHLMQRNE